jgi:hypothetical protein
VTILKEERLKTGKLYIIPKRKYKQSMISNDETVMMGETLSAVSRQSD